MARRPSLPKMNESKFVLVLVVVLNRWENSGQNRAVKLCAHAVRLLHGFAFKLRPRKTRMRGLPIAGARERAGVSEPLEHEHDDEHEYD